MTISISGTVYTDRGVSPMGSGRTVKVSKNGAAAFASTTTAGDGTFSFSGLAVVILDVLTVYLQGNTEVGATVLVSSTGGNITGAAIYQDCLLIQSPTGAATGPTLPNINTSDNNGDSGITSIYSSSSNTTLSMASGKTLYYTGSARITGSGTITLNGDFFSNSSATLSGTDWVFASGGVLTIPGGSVQLGNLTINCAGQTVTLGSAITVTSNKILTLQAGTLDVSASNYAITLLGGGSLTHWTNTGGTFTPRLGTVTVTTGTAFGKITSNGQSFYNLSITGTSGTITLNDALVVTNNLSIDSGKTLATGNFNVTVGGNWSNSGTFTAGTGTVTFNGTAQTISGSTTFYNFVANTSGDVLTFTDGTTQTVTNSVTLQNVTLQGTSTGGWTVAMPATQTIDHVTVSYSTATGNTAVAGAGSVNNGNNVNWTFPSAGSASARTGAQAVERFWSQMNWGAG